MKGATQQDGKLHLKSILDRCRLLQDEVEAFEAQIRKLKRVDRIEIRPLQSAIKADLKSVSKIDASKCNEEQLTQKLRSSNSGFYCTVWHVAKQCAGVTAFFRQFADERHEKAGPREKKRPTSCVDIVADDGATWIKVATVTERTLLFDIAKQGWELGSSSSDGEGPSRPRDDDDDDDVPLLKTAKELCKAAQANRFRYQHPHVRIVLTNIREGRQDAIDKILERIRHLDVEVVSEDEAVSVDLQEAFARMVGDPLDCLRGTSTANICCTILLAIVSDLSNCNVAKEPWLHTATNRQIEQERDESLLPSLLYPALGARELVSTFDAVKRMLEIVVTIGTETEKARTMALIDLPLLRDHEAMDGILDAIEQDQAVRFTSREDRIASLAKLSDHPVPSMLQVPVRVDSIDVAMLCQGLPDVSRKVSDQLSQLNSSVFLYGWHRRIPTVTSNRAAVKHLETIIDQWQSQTGEDLVGPNVWLCSVPRSLRAKDKHRQE